MDPVSATLMAVKTAGEVLQGVQAMEQGNAEAKAARMEARQAINAANTDAARMRYSGERQLGQLRAAQAASGVDMSTGSAADVAAESAKNMELDALTVVHGGILRATQKEGEARMAKYAGKQALLGAAFKAGGTALAALSQVDWSKKKTDTGTAKSILDSSLGYKSSSNYGQA